MLFDRLNGTRLFAFFCMYELLICKSVNSTKQKAEKIDDTMRDKRQSTLTLKFKKSRSSDFVGLFTNVYREK